MNKANFRDLFKSLGIILIFLVIIGLVWINIYPEEFKQMFFLQEKVGWKRLAAIAFGFLGILIILRPGIKVFDPFSLLALACAFSYAVYQILTRFVSAFDKSETSFFYTGITGAFILSFVGPLFYIDVNSLDIILIIMPKQPRLSSQ